MRRTNQLAAAMLLTAAIVISAAPWSRSEEKAPAGAEGGHEHMRMGEGGGMGKMGMMHGHRMQMGPMMGGCPMMDPHVALKVDKIKNGATLTLTSDDPKVVRRIQLRAEIMHLMHELESDGGSTEGE